MSLPARIEFFGGPFCGFEFFPRTECVRSAHLSSDEEEPLNLGAPVFCHWLESDVLCVHGFLSGQIYRWVDGDDWYAWDPPADWGGWYDEEDEDPDWDPPSGDDARVEVPDPWLWEIPAQDLRL